MPGRDGSWIASGDRLAGERGSRFCRAEAREFARVSALRALGKMGGTARPRRGLARHGTMGGLKRRTLSPMEFAAAAPASRFALLHGAQGDKQTGGEGLLGRLGLPKCRLGHIMQGEEQTGS